MCTHITCIIYKNPAYIFMHILLYGTSRVQQTMLRIFRKLVLDISPEIFGKISLVTDSGRSAIPENISFQNANIKNSEKNQEVSKINS